MIEAYMQATLDVLRLAGQMFLARMDDQLRWFSDDLRAFIFDLERNPRRDWRERFDAMLAEQASRACMITPESRATLIAYLEVWEQNVFGGPPQPPKPKSSAHPGGVWNPLNWPRAIYTGDANSSDADYAAAMEAMGEYYRDNAGRTHQQLQIINSFDPTHLTTVVDGVLTTAEGEELHAIVMENQSDTLGAILTATEVLGQIRDAKDLAKALKNTKRFTKFADEAERLDKLPDQTLTNRRPIEQPRDASGRFAPKKGGEMRPGSIAEAKVWEAIENKPGWRLIRGRVSVKDAAGNTRVYDGVAVSPSGRRIGLEVKSGTARKTPHQRDFDARLNASPSNKASGVGKSREVVVDRAIEVRK